MGNGSAIGTDCDDRRRIRDTHCSSRHRGHSEGPDLGHRGAGAVRTARALLAASLDGQFSAASTSTLVKNKRSFGSKCRDVELCRLPVQSCSCARYRAITSAHYRRAVGALLVYDVRLYFLLHINLPVLEVCIPNSLISSVLSISSERMCENIFI